MPPAAVVTAQTKSPVLLYDGTCGFCNRGVQFIIARDRQQTMRFAALQSEYGRSLVARHPELQGVDSVVYVAPPAAGAATEKVYVRSTAALKVAAYLGGVWQLAQLAYLIPRSLRDWAYDVFARNRYRWFGKTDACMLPPPETRARFIDV